MLFFVRNSSFQSGSKKKRFWLKAVRGCFSACRLKQQSRGLSVRLSRMEVRSFASLNRVLMIWLCMVALLPSPLFRHKGCTRRRALARLKPALWQAGLLPQWVFSGARVTTRRICQLVNDGGLLGESRRDSGAVSPTDQNILSSLPFASWPSNASVSRWH